MPRVIFEAEPNACKIIKAGDLFYLQGEDEDNACIVVSIEPNEYRLICLGDGKIWGDTNVYGKTVSEIIKDFAQYTYKVTYFDGDKAKIVVRA